MNLEERLSRLRKLNIWFSRTCLFRFFATKEKQLDIAVLLFHVVDNLNHCKLLPASDHLCNLLALRAESGLLTTRLEGQEKEIGQLRKQIKHLEEKERVANESVIFSPMSSLMSQVHHLNLFKIMINDQVLIAF